MPTHVHGVHTDAAAQGCGLHACKSQRISFFAVVPFSVLKKAAAAVEDVEQSFGRAIRTTGPPLVEKQGLALSSRGFNSVACDCEGVRPR